MVVSSVVIVMLFSFIPFVDWAAHLGGLIAGFLVGIAIFGVDLKASWWVRILIGLIGIVSSVVVFSRAIYYMYNDVEGIEELRDVCGYYKQNFEEYECNCMREEQEDH